MDDMKHYMISNYVRRYDANLAKVICYPFSNVREQFFNRMNDLLKLGVDKIFSHGRVQIGKIRVLGKGHTSIVILGERRGLKVAIKVLRLDANRKSMKREALMLARANAVSVGPKFITFSKNFLIYEYVEGVLLGEWILKVNSIDLLRRVLVILAQQTWRLDSIGLVHLELSNPKKHIIIEKSTYNPVIIDFETSSFLSTKSNLTRVIQYFLLNPRLKNELLMSLREKISKEELYRLLKLYKIRREWKVAKEIIFMISNAGGGI